MLVQSLLPLAVSCWPSTTPTGTVLTVELEVTDTSKRLEDVHVSFMCPAEANPQVRQRHTSFPQPVFEKVA